MGKKGARTREQLIAQAAAVFNAQGYAGTSMSDLTRACGLEKGGIYNHFPSKEALALASFWHAAGLFYERFERAMAPGPGARDRLKAMVAEFARLPQDLPVPGGCPLVKAAVGSHEGLKRAAQQAMENWQRLIGMTVKAGQAGGEFGPRVEPRGVANLLVAALEGGLVLALLHADPDHLQRVCAHLDSYLDSL